MEYEIRKMCEPDWDNIPRVELVHTGWLEPAPVRAWAQLCRVGETLWGRMEAEETPVVATLTGKLDQVCNDSCLEFFFAPDAGDERYFNFEFNPLGTLYLGFGGSRSTRVRQIVKDPEVLFAPRPFQTERGWGISWCIPGEFIRRYFPGYSMVGTCAGNFYKCGDKTPRPHYLSWNPTTSSTPNFHRRQDFGRLSFEGGEDE